MDNSLYDEFGNYIGGDMLASSSSEEDENEDQMVYIIVDYILFINSHSFNFLISQTIPFSPFFSSFSSLFL